MGSVMGYATDSVVDVWWMYKQAVVCNARVPKGLGILPQCG